MDTSPKVPSYGVTNDEIMDYLKHTMVTKKEVTLLSTKIALLPTREDLGKMEHRIRDYADTKFDKLRFDIQGDIVTQSRKEDQKLVSLIEILALKHIISEQEAKALFQMEPFPRSAV